jgi:NADP-dependent 3-hydroxy acid dehydrogenase YdfG
VRDVIHPAGTKLFGQVDIEETIQMPALDAESLVTTNLIGGKFGIPSIGPNTIVSNNAMVSLSFNIPSIAANTVVSNPIVYSSTSGFVRVSNVNVISHYLTKPVTGYLIEPVLLGTRTVVQGDGADTFSTFLSGGTQIEIEDRIPGATGNTTYIVNTVYSNTTFTINSNFAGDSMANGVFRYT